MSIAKISKYLASCLAAGAMLAATVPVNADGRLTAPVADWTGGAVSCKVLQIILEREMDYKVKRITMPSGAGVWEAIAAGDLDFACESWPSYNPLMNEMITKFGGDGSVQYMDPMGVVGISSYYVPRYFIDEVAPDLKTWEDLNRYKEHFATLETSGKGRLLACPTTAWECEDQKRLDLLGIDFVAVELGTEAAHWAEAQGAYARKEPFLLYAWEPHWIHAELDLVSIMLPEHDAEKWPATGWAEDVTFNYGNPESMADNPDAAQLITNQNLSNADNSAMTYEIDVKGRDIDEVVEEWMAANEDVWRQWLPN